MFISHCLPVYLTQIKLAGFKSFAEATTIATPGRLVGVVGPNGCGKSNIIDAVRWVLGESRAAELRGESMQDVIFNGTATRKPAARASVELVFDNSAGRAGGAWRAYGELAIRRVLVRDASSSYFINGQPVRRRDVHDVFLGTGLGSRGYAIIGQGMINRLIEARPEDLRAYLEEAAGVTRYRERRRETENRLRETRENLQRVDDILHELEAQLQRLHTQLRAVRRYQALQDEHRQKQALLGFLGERDAREEQAAQGRALEAARTQLEALTARLRAQEAQGELARQAWHEAGEALHAAQGQVYEAGAQVGRLESELRHLSDARRRLQAQHESLGEQQARWARQVQAYEVQIAQAQAQAEAAQLRAQALMREGEALKEGLPALTQAAAQAGQAQDRARRNLADTERDLALARQARENQLRQHQGALARLERLQRERDALTMPQASAVSALEAAVDEQVAQEQSLAQEAKALLAALPADEQQWRACREAVEKLQQEVVGLRARQAALQTVQDSAQDQGQLPAWLKRQGLAQRQRLWQALRLEAGWETAVEAVLGERVMALALDDLSQAQALSAAAPPAGVVVYATPVAGPVLPASLPPPPGFQALSSRISAQDAGLQGLLAGWLEGVFACDSLEAALASRHLLRAGQCCVVPAGHVVDAHSVHLYAPDFEKAGFLERRQTLEQLANEQARQQALLDAARAALQQADTHYQEKRQALERTRSRLSALTRDLHDRQLALAQARQAQAHAIDKKARLDDDFQDARAQADSAQAQAAQLSEQCQGLEESLAGLRAQEQAAGDAARRSRDQRDKARAALQVHEHQRQASEQEARTARARGVDLQEARQGMRLQREQALADQEGLAQELGRLDEARMQDALQAAQARHQACNDGLAASRATHEALAQRLRAQDEARLELERALEPAREAVSQAQLQEQAARLRAEQWSASLDAIQADRDALAAALAAAPAQWHSPDWLEEELGKLSRRIEAMGGVNLAAADELAVAQERQGYLQAQHADLDQAMRTLQDAVQRIDSETRRRLQQTFEAVNRHFGEFFPTLFGGGQASLVMTGDEILDSGVQVMAQPPGKRNATIQLLSGGEKALTAIALVFSLFRLNPAPFCLLDEVDAPLDDVNTGRYCQLVTTMSAQTQFLFISHNKIAMQMAEQLIGVTMQEEGVSRVVAVDMAAALQMTNEGG